MEPPELAIGAESVWEAFWRLTTDRQSGMGVGPIPWTALDRWAVRHAIDDPDEFDEFEELIMSMDQVYLEHVRKEQAAAAKAAQRPGSGRGRR
jgi:hypothetical protein